jgi:hypothetical protein
MKTRKQSELDLETEFDFLASHAKLHRTALSGTRMFLFLVSFEQCVRGIHHSFDCGKGGSFAGDIKSRHFVFALTTHASTLVKKSADDVLGGTAAGDINNLGKFTAGFRRTMTPQGCRIVSQIFVCRAKLGPNVFCQIANFDTLTFPSTCTVRGKTR